MSQQLPIKCTHGHKVCPECSAYKMVFLLKNRKGLEYNVTGMLRRFENEVIYKFANVIQFYETESNTLVAEKRF